VNASSKHPSLYEYTFAQLFELLGVTEDERQLAKAKVFFVRAVRRSARRLDRQDRLRKGVHTAGRIVRRLVRRVARVHRARRVARSPALASDPDPAQVISQSSLLRPSSDRGGFFISTNEIARAGVPAISRSENRDGTDITCAIITR
jgi:hypothetical protein